MPTCGGWPTGSYQTASGANCARTAGLSLAFEAATYASATSLTCSGVGMAPTYARDRVIGERAPRLVDDSALESALWLGKLWIHRLARLEQERRGRDAGNPLVVGGNDVPRRVLRRGGGDRVVVEAHVFVP